MNRRELVLGTHSRSCNQFDIWEAVFGPMGSDGFPQRLYNKRTGEINATTAAYWKENYDLRHILQRDSKLLARKLQGAMLMNLVNSTHNYSSIRRTYNCQRAVDRMSVVVGYRQHYASTDFETMGHTDV
jgi:hypothetical protein